jgi:hypothetical protein
MIRLILGLVLAVLALVEWLYGTYCWFRMYWNLKPNLAFYNMIPVEHELTPRGQQYMRKTWWAFLIGLLLTILLQLINPDAA